MNSISEEYRVDQAATGPAQSESVVSVRGLVKRYGSHEAVAGIDLEVRRGEIFAFLGPNGAGKTTTVEILEGFQQRTEGQVSVQVTIRARPRNPAGPASLIFPSCGRPADTVASPGAARVEHAIDRRPPGVRSGVAGGERPAGRRRLLGLVHKGPLLLAATRSARA
jgi:energy-coupling factor transporter ATP-binding protein EcfA2